MILLAPLANGPGVGLIKRATGEDIHSGQIALPGGRIEPGESPLEAALRETEEEIGVPARAIRALGFLPLARTLSTGFVVWPVVGALAEETEIKIAPSEVEEFFWAPVSYIESLRDLDQSALVTGVEFNGRRIWGLTLRILVQIARILSADTEEEKNML